MFQDMIQYRSFSSLHLISELSAHDLAPENYPKTAARAEDDGHVLLTPPRHRECPHWELRYPGKAGLWKRVGAWDHENFDRADVRRWREELCELLHHCTLDRIWTTKPEAMQGWEATPMIALLDCPEDNGWLSDINCIRLSVEIPQVFLKLDCRRDRLLARGSTPPDDESLRRWLKALHRLVNHGKNFGGAVAYHTIRTYYWSEENPEKVLIHPGAR